MCASVDKSFMNSKMINTQLISDRYLWIVHVFNRNEHYRSLGNSQFIPITPTD